MSRSICTGQVVRGEEIHVIRGDASPGYIRVNSAPIRDGDGNIVAGVVTYDDVTVEKEQRNVTETLLRISTLISSELDQDALTQKLTHEATRLSRAEFGAFFYKVIDDAGESYMLYTLSGVHRSAFSKFPMPRNTAIFAPTFSGEAVVRIDDVKKDPRYGQNAPYHGMPEGHLPVTSYLAAPVKSRNGEMVKCLVGSSLATPRLASLLRRTSGSSRRSRFSRSAARGSVMLRLVCAHHGAGSGAPSSKRWHGTVGGLDGLSKVLRIYWWETTVRN